MGLETGVERRICWIVNRGVISASQGDVWSDRENELQIRAQHVPIISVMADARILNVSIEGA